MLDTWHKTKYKMFFLTAHCNVVMTKYTWKISFFFFFFFFLSVIIVDGFYILARTVVSVPVLF